LNHAGGLFASGNCVKQSRPSGTIPGKKETAFLHPAIALNGKRNSGQKGNLLFLE
jgi:hypothetical protein